MGMNQFIALIIPQVGSVCSELLRWRLSHPKVASSPVPAAVPKISPPPVEDGEEKIKSGTACLPCTNSHLHACTGLLDEASRMSPDGLTPDSMQRVDKCLGEIAAAERIDLAPENVVGLPEDEKKIATYAAKELREIRHTLEGLNNKEELEQVAARTTELQKYVGGKMFRLRLSKMPKEQKAKLVEDTLANIEKEA